MRLVLLLTKEDLRQDSVDKRIENLGISDFAVESRMTSIRVLGMNCDLIVYKDGNKVKTLKDRGGIF